MFTKYTNEFPAWHGRTRTGRDAKQPYALGRRNNCTSESMPEHAGPAQPGRVMAKPTASASGAIDAPPSRLATGTSDGRRTPPPPPDLPLLDTGKPTNPAAEHRPAVLCRSLPITVL